MGDWRNQISLVRNFFSLDLCSARAKLLFFTLSFFYGFAYSQSFTASEIQQMVKVLSDEPGYQTKDLKIIFQKPMVKKIPDVVKLNLTEPLQLSDKKYSHFSEPFAINLAQKFAKKWRTTLKRAASKYQVDPEVIVAILLVETSFGRFMGNFNLLSIYTSTYLESVALIQSSEFETLAQSMQERLKRKRDWSLNEIRSILKIEKKYPGLKIFHMKGSYAGAFGKSQFLPSSYLKFSVRARQNGTPDLFFEPDAIHSIANYLKGHGYERGLDRPESRNAIFAYNNSQVYVNTVLRVAETIRKKLGHQK